MFTGERQDKVAARIRRAHVLHDLGRHDRAAAEAAMARDTAATEEWPELEGAAAEIEGWSLFENDRFDEARAALAGVPGLPAGGGAVRAHRRLAHRGRGRHAGIDHEPGGTVRPAPDGPRGRRPPRRGRRTHHPCRRAP